MISFDHLEMRYEPFPIGVAKPAMDQAVYDQLVAHLPPDELFQDYAYLGKRGTKLTLSEKEDRKTFLEFIRKTPVWLEFYRYVKSDAFIYGVMDTLRAHYVDLGYRPIPLGKRVTRQVKNAFRARRQLTPPRLVSRFEFSALPADGGNLPPHTDAPSKVVTLILTMVRPGEWNPAFGGGTDINRPKSQRFAFDWLNKGASFDDMEVIDTYAFNPNQVIVFVKTFNSWHSVRPILGHGSAALRRTLTINIERTA